MNKTIKSTDARAISNDVTRNTDNCNSNNTTNKKDAVSAVTNIKVLGTSNRLPTTSDSKLKKMGISKTVTPTSRRSKRISTTFGANQLKRTSGKFTKRKTIDPKSFNQTTVASVKATNETTFVKPNKSTEKFQCKDCNMTFFYKTSLAAHQKSHMTANTCNYCNRNFVISAALSKHLRENCTKITIAERKKLLDDDEKSIDSNRQKTPKKTPTRTSTRTPKLRRVSTDELLSLVYKTCSPSQVDRLKAMPIKRVPLIKGIGNTPRRLIKCYKCGSKFKDPVSYATHAEECVPNNGVDNL